jgi:integrase
MPNYTRRGKVERPIEPEEWADLMAKGRFVHVPQHPAFCAVLYYFAVRSGEALKATKEQFTYDDEALYFDVGERLKHSHRTPTLNIRRDLPYVRAIVMTVDMTGAGQRVFPYSRRTGYNITDRVFKTYPHFFRLSRITSMFDDGWTVTEVRSWTGLTLNALNYYVGLAAIREKGRTIR